MFDKRAQALAALRAAELHTGVTPVIDLVQLAPNRSSPVESDTRLEVGGNLADADGNANTIPDEEAGNYSVENELSQSLGLLPEVAKLVPGGRINPGSVFTVIGSRMLHLSLLAAASQAGTWVAIVGQPDLGVAAIAQAGLALERVALVPDPSGDAALVCAALLEAVCIVVGVEVDLRDSERRRLAARARERGTVIISEAPWPGAQLTLEAGRRSWLGANQGEGWLQSWRMEVQRTGRGSAAKPKQFQITLPCYSSQTASS